MAKILRGILRRTKFDTELATPLFLYEGEETGVFETLKLEGHLPDLDELEADRPFAPSAGFKMTLKEAVEKTFPLTREEPGFLPFKEAVEAFVKHAGLGTRVEEVELAEWADAPREKGGSA